MSLVLSPVEVVPGPMVGIKEHHQVGLPDFTHGVKELMTVKEQGRKTEDSSVVNKRGRNGYVSRIEDKEEMEEEAELSSQSSSIGVESSASSEEEEEENLETGDEAQSKLKDEGLFGSLDSLEEALPIKRGLSNFFSGKSKSFTSLSDVASSVVYATDLAKREKPFNKRRRILLSCKASWKRRASFTSFSTPLLVVNEEGTEEEDENKREAGDLPSPPFLIHGDGKELIRNAFKAPRSFSLSDLQFV